MNITICGEPIKPRTIEIPSPFYGFPKGVDGRAGSSIQGIVIHCGELDKYRRNADILGSAGRPDGTPRKSVHYGIPFSGIVEQYIADADIAWGLSPSTTVPSWTITYPAADTSFEWGLAFDNVGIAPDKYLIHIVVEGGTRKVFEANQVSGCDCSTPDPSLSPSQYAKLISLIAYLMNAYSIPQDENYINFFDNLDKAGRPSCGCTPCIDRIFCSLDSYCQAQTDQKDAGYSRIVGEIAFVYGEDIYGRKCKISIEDLAAQIAAL